MAINDHLHKVACSEMWSPRVLLLGPAGSRHSLYLGFLTVLEDRGYLKQVDTYVGTSASAITSLLLSVGYSVREVITALVSIEPIHDLTTVTCRDDMSVNNQYLRRILTELIVEKLGMIPNLYQLYLKTGRSLITTTTDLTMTSPELLTPFSRPDLSCIEAVIMSLNMPFLRHQLIHYDHLYADGLLHWAYPIEAFDHDETKVLMIGVTQVTTTSIKYREVVDMTIEPSIRAIDITRQLIDWLLHQHYQRALSHTSSHCRSCLIVGSATVVSDRAENEAQMLASGYRQAEDWLLEDRETRLVYPTYTYPSN